MQSFKGVAAVFILHLLVEHFDGHDFFDEYLGALFFHWGLGLGECGGIGVWRRSTHPARWAPLRGGDFHASLS